MSNSGNLYNEEPFSSFLAGVLLTRREISNPEFCQLMNNFSETYDASIVGFDGADVPVLINDSGFRLINDYSDVIIIDNKKMTVEKYLNSIVTSRVREFFNLSPDVKKKNDDIFANIKKLVRKFR